MNKCGDRFLQRTTTDKTTNPPSRVFKWRSSRKTKHKILHRSMIVLLSLVNLATKISGRQVSRDMLILYIPGRDDPFVSYSNFNWYT